MTAAGTDTEPVLERTSLGARAPAPLLGPKALSPDALRAVASLLEYPDDGYRAQVARAAGVLEREAGLEALFGAATDLFRWASSVDLEEAQEIYTRTFDMSPAATLDVGWHVFGESYKRGALLVGLRGELREHGIDPGTELPDHLPVVLELLAVMPDDEDREMLRKGIVGPAIRGMAVAFHGSTHPFAGVLRAAAACLAPDVRRSAHLPVLRSPSEAMEGRDA